MPKTDSTAADKRATGNGKVPFRLSWRPGPWSDGSNFHLRNWSENDFCNRLERFWQHSSVLKMLTDGPWMLWLEYQFVLMTLARTRVVALPVTSWAILGLLT